MSETLTQMFDRMLASTPNAWPPDTIRIVRNRAAELERALALVCERVDECWSHNTEFGEVQYWLGKAREEAADETAD